MLTLSINLCRGLIRGVAVGVVSLVLAAGDTGPAGWAEAAYRQVIAEGILARTLHVARIPDAGFEVETWEMLVAAHRAEDGEAALPGGAVLEVLSGRGSVRVNEKSREVEPGTVTILDQGSKIAFDNRRGAEPLVWRVTLIRMLIP
jgi:hypothetical protein